MTQKEINKRLKRMKEQIYPSQEFGIHIGMPDLFVEWKMPGDKSADECARELLAWNWAKLDSEEEKKGEKIMHQFYSELVELNTDLYRIEVKTNSQIYDVCMGAVSKFNFEDIKFFSLIEKTELLKYNVNNKGTYDRIENKCNKYPEWILCPSNLQKVLDALGI